MSEAEALQVVEPFQWTDDQGVSHAGGTQVGAHEGVVVLSCHIKDFPRAIAMLSHGYTKTVAVAEAAKRGLPDPRVSGTTHPYAVTDAGHPVTDPRSQRVDHYRIDVPVVRRLV